MYSLGTPESVRVKVVEVFFCGILIAAGIQENIALGTGLVGVYAVWNLFQALVFVGRVATGEHHRTSY